MKRKVLKIADTTYVVSIPLKWARKHNVSKGDEIEIEEAGSNLLMRFSNPEISSKKYSVDLTGSGSFATRIIASLYKDGYDELEIKYDDPDNLKKILNLYFIGYEIVTYSKGAFIVKTISDIVDLEIPPMFRRTFLLLKAMAIDMDKAIQNKDQDALKSIKASEESNNRFTTFLRRAIMKKDIYSGEEKILVYSVVEGLEKVADEYKYLSTYLIENPKSLDSMSSDLVKLSAELSGYFSRFYDLYFNFVLNEAKSLAQSRKDMIKKIEKVMEHGKNPDMRISHYYLNIVQSVADLLSFRMSMFFLKDEKAKT